MTTEPTPAKRTTMNGKPVFRVPVKTVLNLHSGFETKLLCDGPALALGDACAYSCSFCYVPAIYQKLDRVRALLEREGLKHEDVVIIREAAIDVLRGQLLHPGGQRKFPDESDRRVVYSSPADDVAANMDLVRATFEACKLILAHTNWQIRLLSKSNLLPKLAAMLVEWATSELDEEALRTTVEMVYARMIFGVSTGTLDDKLASVFEEGTPNVTKRIESLHVLQDNGFRTFAMVCPSLPMGSIDKYQAFAHEAKMRLRYEKCEHVWAEVINLRGDSFKRTYKALNDAGFDRLAYLIDKVSHDSDAWETYNRETFLAHALVCDSLVGKLRYLTYVKDANRGWWEKNISRGAVILSAKPEPKERTMEIPGICDNP